MQTDSKEKYRDADLAEQSERLGRVHYIEHKWAYDQASQYMSYDEWLAQETHQHRNARCYNDDEAQFCE